MRRAWVNWLLLVAYAALSAVLFAHHEPWRDETRAWIMARDVPGLLKLLRLMGYEGSPALWFLLLRPFAVAGCPYWVMPLLHHLLALAAVVLLVFRSPFSALEKALFIFGYFGLFEYNVIARSYVLTMLLLFALAATYSRREERPWPHAVLLALLAQTNTHSLLISFLWAGLWGLASWRRQGWAAARTLGGPLALWAASVVGAAWQMLPPADLDTRIAGVGPMIPRHPVWTSGEVLANVFFPLPYTAGWGLHRLRLFVAPVMLGATAFLWQGRRQPAALFCGGVALLLALFLLKYPGSIRHHGLLLLLLLSTQWVTRQAADTPPERGALLPRRWPALLLALLLVPQVYGGYQAFRREMTQVFAGERDTARFLQSRHLYGPDVLLATYPSAISSGVLAWLPREQQAYFVELRRFATFVTWTRELQANQRLPLSEVLRRVDEAARRGHYRATVVLIAGKETTLPEDGRNRLQFEQAGHWRSDETIRVYLRLPPPRPEALP